MHILKVQSKSVSKKCFSFPVKWRTIKFKDSNEVDSRTISPKGDEVVFSVEKGKVLLKFG